MDLGQDMPFGMPTYLRKKVNMAYEGIRGVLADTCFWIAAFDSREREHEKAASLLRNIRKGIILMPWPVMYETLGTRMVKKQPMLRAFTSILQEKVVRIDDSPYRESCLLDALSETRPLSLVDRIVRKVLQDEKYRITQLLTFNQGDFSDVCGTRILMWP